MPEYHVAWNVELEAETPEDAARKALEIHRSRSSATVFKITDEHGEETEIDLGEAHETPTDAVISEIIESAVNWISADADNPDTPPEWQAVFPLLRQIPALSGALVDCLGAMSAMRHQIEQMRGLFPDGDGTVEEACAAHHGTEEDVGRLLSGSLSLDFTNAAMGMLEAAVDHWGEDVAKDRPINGADAVDWLSRFIAAAGPLVKAAKPERPV